MYKPKLVEFPGGKFIFSVTNEEVEVKPFAMAVFPVTNQEYEEFDPLHQRCEYSDQDNQPVVNVSYNDACNYCKWLSERTGEHYRLPSEAEWEFAASGGGKRKYPWGNDKPTRKLANYNMHVGKTTAVGSYSLGMTHEGLHDIAGNVWEWCEGAYKHVGRVVRGGSFNFNESSLRCAARDVLGNWYSDVGFRVVRGPSLII